MKNLLSLFLLFSFITSCYPQDVKLLLRKEVNAQVISWLDRYLKNGEALPNMEYHGK